jgi:RHS repeat-associated protein
VPGGGLESWTIPLPVGATVWTFDPAGGIWEADYAGALAPVANLAREIGPGEALYVHSAESIELDPPSPHQQVAYYHPDHLDSSTAVSDGAGELLEETAFHPYGTIRHRERQAAGGLAPAYGFTQKENDHESRLHYFEARYLVGSLARFPSFDPLVQRLDALPDDERKKVLTQPAKLNPFAYALNNPVRYNDPDGRDPRPRSTGHRPKPPAPPAELTIRIGPAARGSKELSASSFNLVLPTSAPITGSVAGGKTRPTPPDIQITRHSDELTSELLSKHRNSTLIKSVTIILPGKDGDFRIHLEDVLIHAISTSPDPVEGKTMETFTLNAGRIRFGDPEPITSTRESTQSWQLEPRTPQ